MAYKITLNILSMFFFYLGGGGVGLLSILSSDNDSSKQLFMLDMMCEGKTLKNKQ